MTPLLRLRVWRLAAALLLLASAGIAAEQTSWTISAPKSGPALTVSLADGRLSYRVTDGTDTVLPASPLGIRRTDTEWTDQISFVAATAPRRIEDDYSLVSGKRSHVHSIATEQTLTFTNRQNARLEITVRAYAHGVAFRYGFPGSGQRVLFVSGDETGFALPKDSRFWAQPYSPVGVWAPGYESDYVDGVPAHTASKTTAGWALPLLFKTGTHWALIAESNVGPQNFAVHLNQPTADGLFTVRLPEADETYGVAPQTAAVTTPWQSPWRAILVGKQAGDIANNTLMTDLAEPAILADTSWIKPGVSSWSWWSDTHSPFEYPKLTPYVDASQAYHWPYTLIDLGWQVMEGGTIEKLVAYARERGVGVLVWYNSGGRHNQVPDAGPYDLLTDPALRDAEFARIAALGIKGIKVDFMQSDKQFVMGLYHDILRDAARHKLLVNFHGCTYPKGWERTYPHLLTMEAVSGGEQYWSQDFANSAARFHTIYPFTRNAVGPMDYTPTVLLSPELKLHNKAIRQTTNAHELALLVVFASGIQHIIDRADSLAAQPPGVKEYLTALPTTWDESLCLAGEPGRLAVFARRKGTSWYVAGINGLDTPQTITVPLAFLGKTKGRAVIIRDGAKQDQVTEESKSVTATDSLTVELRARGGFAASIK
ncbi:glycoside hydrolase family 97 catalytic domain-containing protein [Nibricoccus sp. IMCC34717]|uniref:glycoside hydrolase family 97 protein n=1 Tax=Nibricoccus sp. IMCC34717 TaxID=3034021 RepID=UPI00384DB10C